MIEFYPAPGLNPIPTGFIFVYGSNESGIHGKGAALDAKLYYGAKQWQGVGRAGRSYGIPTKDGRLNVLPLERIAMYVMDFVAETQCSSDLWYVTPIGCGLAGYRPKDIAPMFRGARNCWFSTDWLPYVL